MMKLNQFLAGAVLMTMTLTGSTHITTAADEEGWVDLFDGKTLKGWRGYKIEDVPPGWSVADGVLTSQPTKGTTDLVTREQYADFELVVEWKIEAGGNSGILYRASEDQKAIWHSAVEIQILDNDIYHGKPIGLEHAAGAVYALWPAKPESFREHGAWNETRIIAKGKNIQVLLNDVEIAAFEIGGAEWNERIAASKFSKFPGMGELPTGHIALQTHGSETSFRSVRLRPL
tara:strand:+ start:41 stop:733 length:693 start_codon:yes stop_codon:yes gene_type:complete